MSSRMYAIALADALTELGRTDPDSLCYADWEDAARHADVGFPTAGERKVVISVLTERDRNPDPFTGFPQ